MFLHHAHYLEEVKVLLGGVPSSIKAPVQVVKHCMHALAAPFPQEP